MATFWILLCIAIVSGSSWAGVPYKDVELNIFADGKWSFEAMALGKNNPTKDDKTLGKIEMALLSSSPAVPYALINQLSDEGWRASFAKTIAKENEATKMKTANSEIQNALVAIQDSLKDAQYTSTPNIETLAKKIRTDILKILEIFSNPNSVFKKYPLVGSPPLIALATFVASFNQKMVNTPTIACAVRNALLDYRSRAVDARLDKLQHDLYFMPQIRSRVMAWPYNKNGYSKSDTLECGGTCDDKSKSMWTANSEADFRPNSQEIMYRCLKDDFSANEFYINNYQNYECAEGYAGLVRHRVEEIFPVQSFNSFCGKDNPTTSAGGYLTMRLKHLATDKEANGNDPKISGDDPFFRLYIDDELTDQIRVKYIDPNEIFVWNLNNKDVLVEVQVNKIPKGDDVIFSTKGTVNDFLTNGLRNGNQGSFFKAYLETVSFWQNENEYQMTLPPVETSPAESLPIIGTEKKPSIDNEKIFRGGRPSFSSWGG